jgi:hypothetical protein
MGNDESQQKPADFHHPVSPEILQAVIDTGGVTDGSIIPLLEGLSPLEMRINLTVRKWKPAYTAFAEARKRTGSKRQRKKEIDAIAKAERILAHWLPFLSADGLNPGNVSSIIAGGKWSEWLKQWPSQAGRPSEFILAECLRIWPRFSNAKGIENHHGRKSGISSQTRFSMPTVSIRAIWGTGFLTS